MVVTNQSAVGRGRISVQQLADIHRELEEQLALEGASLDGIYYCAAVPETDDRTIVEFEDRKPGPGMLKLAATDLDLEMSSSWMVGDKISDVLAGVNAGCRGTILLGEDREHPDLGAGIPAIPFFRAACMEEVLSLILELDPVDSFPEAR